MSTTADQTSSTELAITTIDRSPESHITRLHRAVIGPISADYYLPVLARLDMRDQAIPIWNWAACLSTLNWMVFRGLWTPALLYVAAVLGAAMAVLGLTQLAAPVTDSIQWSLWAGAVTLALLVPGFFGNAWLYAVYRRRLTNALSGTASVQDACVLLGRQASSRPRLAWIVLVNLVLAALVLASWLALPSRHRQGPVDGDLVSAATPAVFAARAASAPTQASAAVADLPAPASSTALAVPVPAGPASDAAVTASSAAASTPVGAAVVPAPAIRPPPVPEMRRSTRFGEAPRAALAGPARAAPSDAAPTMPAADKPTGRFMINVGLFAQDDNARRVQARLVDAGLPVVSQELQRASRTLTRVRVGPFTTRADADDAAQKIRALKLDAIVTRQ